MKSFFFNIAFLALFFSVPVSAVNSDDESETTQDETQEVFERFVDAVSNGNAAYVYNALEHADRGVPAYETLLEDIRAHGHDLLLETVNRPDIANVLIARGAVADPGVALRYYADRTLDPDARAPAYRGSLLCWIVAVVLAALPHQSVDTAIRLANCAAASLFAKRK